VLMNEYGNSLVQTCLFQICLQRKACVGHCRSQGCMRMAIDRYRRFFIGDPIQTRGLGLRLGSSIGVNLYA
jgi:hypothetical protein